MRTGQISDLLQPPPVADLPLPGYRLIRSRGRGGVAEVWEAEAPGGFRVALKLVQLSTDLRSGELRSLEIVRGIRHPHLLAIFGAWHVDSLLVIGMELADRSLWDRFVEVRSEGLRGIPRKELLAYFGDAANAIDYLNDYRHSVENRRGIGIQHGDLKPQNILLVGDCAKVADFGMARVMDQSVASHTGSCTLAYAPPELFRKQLSRQSDQYSLAVSYCQLRGGSLPFQGTTAQVAVGHLLGEPELVHLPEPERPIVARALSKRPKDRWPDCRSFVDALRTAGGDDGAAVPELLEQVEEIGDTFAGSGDLPDGSSGLLWSPGIADYLLVKPDGSGGPPLDSPPASPSAPAFADSAPAPSLVDGENALDEQATAPTEELAAIALRLDGLPQALPGASETPPAAHADLSAEEGLSLVAEPSRDGDRGDECDPGNADGNHIPGHPADIGISAREPLPATILRRHGPRARLKRRMPGHRAVSAALGMALVAGGMPLVATFIHPLASEAGGRRLIRPAASVPSGELAAGRVSHVLGTRQGSDGPRVSPSVGGTTAPSRQAIENMEVLRSATKRWGPVAREILAVAISTPATGATQSRPDLQRGAKERASARRGDLAPAPGDAAPEPAIALPSEVEVFAGAEAPVKVRVWRSAKGAVLLDVRGLPRGIEIAPATLAVGSDQARLKLVASADASPGTWDVSIGFQQGPRRVEGSLRVVVKPAPDAEAYKKALAAMASRDYERALLSLNEGVRLAPRSFEVRRQRALVHHLLGHDRDALADYDEALALRPEDAECLLGKARVHRKRGEKTAAEKAYSTVLNRQPSPEAFVGRARLRQERGAYTEALGDFDAALQLRPTDTTIYYHRGLARYHSGDNSGAIADFSEAIRHDPKHAMAYRFRGEAYARSGDRERAAADHEKYEKLSKPGEKGSGADKAGSKPSPSPRQRTATL